MLENNTLSPWMVVTMMFVCLNATVLLQIISHTVLSSMLHGHCHCVAIYIPCHRYLFVPFPLCCHSWQHNGNVMATQCQCHGNTRATISNIAMGIFGSVHVTLLVTFLTAPESKGVSISAGSSPHSFYPDSIL